MCESLLVAFLWYDQNEHLAEEEGAMRIACMLCVAATLALAIASCQDYVCIFPEESLDGIKGRLWVSPNPIAFPIIEHADVPFFVEIRFSNIGSERER